jgi:hypothetical protein
VATSDKSGVDQSRREGACHPDCDTFSLSVQMNMTDLGFVWMYLCMDVFLVWIVYRMPQ